MQCAFGLMLGTELVWKKLKCYGKGLIVTTLTQSLGTFLFVTLVFAIVFLLADIPVYLSFVFGGIALATTPAPALSIVNEFHAKGPVTDTLLPMAVLSGITLNYMLMGVSFSAVFTNMVGKERLEKITGYFHPILAVSLLAAIVDLGAPLNYHLILGAGLYAFLYIAARGAGKYFGARFGAKRMKMTDTVQKYLGLTLLPHSGVSLVFTGIACSTLAAEPELVGIVQGTIAAAAVINEIIAAIAAKKGFELAGEIGGE